MIATDSLLSTSSPDSQITMYESGLAVLAVVVCVNLFSMLGEVNGFHCDENPCENGGTCVEYDSVGSVNNSDSHTTYYCTCLPCYRGEHCQTHITECDTTCYNGGTCVVDALCRQTCQCKACTRGSFCETVLSGCDDGVCHNGGRCQTTGDQCDDFICICPSCYLGRDCRITDEECLRNFIPTTNPNQTLSSSEAAGDEVMRESKESMLSSVIVILIVILVFVIIISLASVCWMYRKYKINAKIVEEQKLKILKMALSREKMMVELSQGSGTEYEYSDVIHGEGSTQDLESKPPDVKTKKNNNVSVKYNSSPPKVIISSTSDDDNHPIMHQANHINQNKEKGIANPLVVRKEEEIQAQINYDIGQDFTDIELNEDVNHSVHDFSESMESGRRRRRTLSPLTSFSTDFANLLSCFRSG